MVASVNGWALKQRLAPSKRIENFRKITEDETMSAVIPGPREAPAGFARVPE
jgi:hypothetical protein